MKSIEVGDQCNKLRDVKRLIEKNTLKNNPLQQQLEKACTHIVGRGNSADVATSVKVSHLQKIQAKTDHDFRAT